MSEQDSSTKTFDPTPKKLEDARKKGEVAKSVDLQTAAGYAGLTLVLLASGAGMIRDAGTHLMVLLDQTEELGRIMFAEGNGQSPMGGILSNIALSIAPLFLVPAVAVMAAILVQRAFVVAPSKLAPKLSRISLIKNAQNKFGRAGLFEFAKSFFKLTIYSVCLGVFLNFRLPDMISIIHAEPGIGLSLLGELCISFLFVVVLISALIGAVDAIFQHQEHIRKNRMSHKEIMDENKEAEGDPYLKQERRSRAQAIAAAQMMSEVPKADVVIVNPTHYAVALKWSREPGTAPECVAKGIDHIALAIREVAQSEGVPIHSDPPTARALHAVTEIGDEIAPEHYQAVAAAIRFADQMRERARRSVVAG